MLLVVSYYNSDIVLDVVTEAQEISSETLPNYEFEQIKVEQESISNLSEQNKATSDSSDVDTPSEPMTGKLCYKISS